jgi:hypothetical protein
MNSTSECFMDTNGHTNMMSKSHSRMDSLTLQPCNRFCRRMYATYQQENSHINLSAIRNQRMVRNIYISMSYSTVVLNLMWQLQCYFRRVRLTYIHMYMYVHLNVIMYVHTYIQWRYLPSLVGDGVLDGLTQMLVVHAAGIAAVDIMLLLLKALVLSFVHNPSSHNGALDGHAEHGCPVLYGLTVTLFPLNATTYRSPASVHNH